MARASFTSFVSIAAPHAHFGIWDLEYVNTDEREEYAARPAERTALWLQGCFGYRIAESRPGGCEMSGISVSFAGYARYSAQRRRETAVKQGGTTELLRPSDEAVPLRLRRL